MLVQLLQKDHGMGYNLFIFKMLDSCNASFNPLLILLGDRSEIDLAAVKLA